MPAIVASFDQGKALDCVGHDYLFSVMRSSGLPESLCEMTKTLYCAAQSRVAVNGALTEPFTIERGVPQGCPLSPALYALSINPLLFNLTADRAVHTLPLPGPASPPVFAYADDLMVILKNEDSLGRVLELFARYGAGSGAQVNREKCVALFINVNPSSAHPYGVPVKTEVKILGIVYNSRGACASNWTRIYRAASDVI